jgi:hypothetical protein
MDETDGELVATARVSDWVGSEVTAEAEHAVTASRTPAAIAIAIAIAIETRPDATRCPPYTAWRFRPYRQWPQPCG